MSPTLHLSECASPHIAPPADKPMTYQSFVGTVMLPSTIRAMAGVHKCKASVLHVSNLKTLAVHVNTKRRVK